MTSVHPPRDRPLHPELERLVAEVLSDVPYGDNPYFRSLRDGSLSHEDFLETQLQFHAAVVFFSRPMAVVASRIEDAALRVEIVRNVWEEHGEGEPSRMHGASFETLLGRLAGWTPGEVKAELARRPLWPEVRAFNTLLVGACGGDDPLVGLATLRVIERMFTEISGWLGRGIVERGFVRAEDLVHYDLHEVLDVRHAADFFVVCGASWDRGTRERERIEAGLRLGAYAFHRLYEDLFAARARRWLREEPATNARGTRG